MINIPTRVTDTTSSLVDLILVNQKDDVVCHGTLPKIADHDGVIVSFDIKTEKVTPKTKTIYDYKNADIAGLCQYIKEYDFDNLVFSSPVLEQTELYTNMLIDSFSKFVPCKNVIIRPLDAPWCTKFTRLLLRKKNRNYLFYKKCDKEYRNSLVDPGISPDILTKILHKRNKAWEKSRQAANVSSKFNRRAKEDFFNTVNNTMHNQSISAKKKFSILIKLMKNSKFSTIPPLVENDTTIQEPVAKSNLLNAFFASKSTVSNPNDLAPELVRQEGVPDLDLLNTSPIEIARFMRNMRKSHASYCGISGMFISIISQPISHSMSKLFNNLFEIGHFPDLWKIAHITAIYKRSGSKASKTNFRPISILPTLSKIFESVIHERLLSHCKENSIITEKQAAYLKGDSTIHQLLYIVHKIRSNWDQNRITHGLFLDISAAFDKVWHNGLIAKLNQIGINGNFLSTLKTYLSGRKQVVVVDGEKSDVLDVQAGVPQGSRLGPLLFIIYINDITENLESDILIFADDTSLLASGIDPAETAAMINRDLEKISEWAEKWKISFNAGKSKDMIFSNKMLNNSPPITFDNSFVKRVNEHKHLGVYLSANLDWSRQIHEICLKANKKLAVLRSIRYLDRQTLDMLYKITVRSVIDYALPVFYHTLKQTEKARLENVQYQAAKLVTGAYNLSSKQKLNRDLGWETIQCRADILGLNIFHKIHVKETRPLIRDCMPKLDRDKDITLRSKIGYQPFKTKSDKFSKSFFHIFLKCGIL